MRESILLKGAMQEHARSCPPLHPSFPSSSLLLSSLELIATPSLCALNPSPPRIRWCRSPSTHRSPRETHGRAGLPSYPCDPSGLVLRLKAYGSDQRCHNRVLLSTGSAFLHDPQTLVSLRLRLKNLLGPVTRVKKKKKGKKLFARACHFTSSRIVAD